MINCNEIENHNESRSYNWPIKLMDLDVDMNTNIQNIACFSKIMSMCNEQHLSNIWCVARFGTICTI